MMVYDIASKIRDLVLTSVISPPFSILKTAVFGQCRVDA